jgi:hypothetical protein
MSNEHKKHAGDAEINKIKAAVDRSLQELQRLASFYQAHRQYSHAKEILKTIADMRSNDRQNFT